MSHTNFMLCLLLLLLTAGCIEKKQNEIEPSEANKPGAVSPKEVEPQRKRPKPRESLTPPKARAAAVVIEKGSDSCPTICQRSKDLKCSIGPDDCLTACKAMQDVPVCKAEMQKVVDCMTTKPPKDWECSEEGIAALKDGVCDDEQRRFMMCIMASEQ